MLFLRDRCEIGHVLQLRYYYIFITTVMTIKVQGASPRVTADTVECFSCMSENLHKSWYALQDFYYAPLNFTDDCNEPFNEKRIRTIVCSSMCVTLIEAFYTSGVPAGHNYIRGCLRNIAKKGLNNLTIRQFGFEIFTVCDKVPRSSLFRNKLFAIDDHVKVCTCWGDKCNGARPNGAYTGASNLHCVILTLSVYAVVSKLFLTTSCSCWKIAENILLPITFFIFVYFCTISHSAVDNSATEVLTFDVDTVSK